MNAWNRLEPLNSRNTVEIKFCFLCSPSQFHPRTPRGGQSGRKKRRDLSWLSPEHFQTVKRMLAPDWAQKCFVLLCPIGEQRLLSSFREFAHDGYWLDYGLSRLRAVSYFSLQSYCKRNLSTQAARLLVARNESVRLLLGSLLFAVGCDSWLIVAYPVQRTRDVVHWRSGSVNHSIKFNSTSWLNSI